MPTLPRVLRSLPPLLTMETLLFRMIAIGFVLLTLTLASGVVFSEEIFGKAWQFNHKVLFGFISWGVFAVLLWGHHYLRLARAYRGALDGERLRIPAAGLSGQQVRARSAAASLIQKTQLCLGGFFAGCKKYPKCRRIRALSLG